MSYITADFYIFGNNTKPVASTAVPEALISRLEAGAKLLIRGIPYTINCAYLELDDKEHVGAKHGVNFGGNPFPKVLASKLRVAMTPITCENGTA